MSRFRKNSVKEALDNLPSGVCFFDKNGFVTLCNHQMQRIVFEMTRKDLQSLLELEHDLSGNEVVLLKDGSAWRFSREKITTDDGTVYTQVTASDITELYLRSKDLEEDNRKLKEYAERMRRLSANIITLIREEEILNMKMRVHDDIGRSVIATRRFLQQKRPMEELDLTEWKNAVRLLKRETEMPEEQDALAGLMTSAYSMGIKIFMDGELPQNPAAEVLTAAVRECMTNAVRHAGARELYVHLTCDDNTAVAVITNDGAPPEAEITMGGGLSSLNIRIRKYGGSMSIKTRPGFEMTVTVPVSAEEAL